jgi:hypothetical protein
MTVSGLPTSLPDGTQELQGRHSVPTLSSPYAHNQHQEAAPNT